MDQALMLCIRERAYYIWTAGGADAEQNWLQAEKEILSISALQRAQTAARTKLVRASNRRGKKVVSWGQASATRRSRGSKRRPAPWPRSIASVPPKIDVSLSVRRKRWQRSRSGRCGNNDAQPGAGSRRGTIQSRPGAWAFWPTTPSRSV